MNNDNEYKDLRVTTMTLIFGLNCKIDLNKIFYLLPVTKIDYTPSTKARTRYKIPHYHVPGSILSMRFRGMTRGIIRTTSGRHFKNSITIDISLKEKNVNIKLCASKMQMCGAKSVEQGYDGALEIINKIEYINNLINRMKDSSKKEYTLNVIKENVYDSEKIWTVINHQGFLPHKISFAIYNDLYKSLPSFSKEESDYDNVITTCVQKYKHMLKDDLTEEDLLNWMKNSLKQTTKINFTPLNADQLQNIDQEYFDFLMSDIDDFNSSNLFIEKLNFVDTLSDLYEGDLEVNNISKAMVNFNYSLGNEIDRFQLKKYMNGRDGFFAHFDNSTEHYVTIELPYQVEKETKKRKNKKPCHSFLVYQSGLVTQSGPDEDLMKQAYKHFISIFNEVRDDVIKS
jgi:hypothetical protein